MGDKRTYQTGSWRWLEEGKKARLEVSLGTGLGGKRQRASRVVAVKTAAKAERALAAFVREMQGRHAAGGYTVARLLDEFQELHVSTLAPNTQRWYRDALRRAYGALGHIKAAELAPPMIAKYYRALGDADAPPFVEGYPCGLDASTVHHHHRALSAALRWAYQQEILDRPIIDRVRAPEGGGKSAHAFALTEEQRAAYLAALDAEAERAGQSVSHHYRALHVCGWEMLGRVALACGLRRGELLGLSWDGVELTEGEGVLRIAQQVQSIGGKLSLAPLKTGTSARAVYLPAALSAGLSRLHQLQREHALSMGLGKPQLVFATLQGTMRDPVHVSRFFRRVFDRAGLADASLHTLRHTAGTLLLQAGFSPADVAAYLGHSTPSTTLGVYAHAQEAQLRSMATVSAALLE